MQLWSFAAFAAFAIFDNSKTAGLRAKLREI